MTFSGLRHQTYGPWVLFIRAVVFTVTVGLSPVAPGDTPEQDPGPSLPDRRALSLPASFTGTLPAASGPGIAWHLDLWPDRVFHLRQDYLGDDSSAADMGRWSLDPQQHRITLRGGREAPVHLEIQENRSLRLLDLHGEPIDSELNYMLDAGPLVPSELSLPLVGGFSYLADAARFIPCLTGRSYPVAMEADYRAAEQAYLRESKREPGAAVLAVLEGRLAPRSSTEGPPGVHVIIERFDRLAPGEHCRGMDALPLADDRDSAVRPGGAVSSAETGNAQPEDTDRE